jgi:hypothetical protein
MLWRYKKHLILLQPDYNFDTLTEVIRLYYSHFKLFTQKSKQTAGIVPMVWHLILIYFIIEGITF